MARPTKGEMFDRARTYLDTDNLNFTDELLDIMLERIWFQAVTMEREWRFFQRQGTAAVTAGDAMVPFVFTTDPNATPTPLTHPGTRILSVSWGNVILPWIEYTTGLDYYLNQTGQPVCWSELNEGPDRHLRLFPAPSMDGSLLVDFYAEPVYPDVGLLQFLDLPAEFDSALLEGLLSDMYYREEDPDLGDMHRNMFLEQMGSIRNRWRISLDTPIVMAGQARRPSSADSRYNDMGAYTSPIAP